jgi:hypothetical protein
MARCYRCFFRLEACAKCGSVPPESLTYVSIRIRITNRRILCISVLARYSSSFSSSISFAGCKNVTHNSHANSGRIRQRFRDTSHPTLIDHRSSMYLLTHDILDAPISTGKLKCLGC